jgi:hypothetical protein
MIERNARDVARFAPARAIVTGDAASTLRMRTTSPVMARASFEEGALDYLDEIGRYFHAGDTACTSPRGTSCTDTVRELIAIRADVCARSQRGSEPLHARCLDYPRSG